MQQTNTLRSDAANLTISYQVATPGSTWADENLSLGPLLEKALELSVSEGAYVYRMSRDGRSLELIAWRGILPINIGHFAVVSSGGAGALEESGPVLSIEKEAALDRRFRSFPEFVGRQFESVVSLRLAVAESIVGIANFCRLQPGPYAPEHVSFLRRLGTSLSVLLQPAIAGGRQAQLQEALRDISRDIEDRQAIEHAKALLQDRHGWTEQFAYAQLRRTSRHRRERIAVVAREIIAGKALRA